MTSPSATHKHHPYQNEPICSRSEKAIARKAFDAALGRELHEVIQEAKKMASQIQQSSSVRNIAWSKVKYAIEETAFHSGPEQRPLSNSNLCEGITRIETCGSSWIPAECNESRKRGK